MTFVYRSRRESRWRPKAIKRDDKAANVVRYHGLAIRMKSLVRAINHRKSLLSTRAVALEAIIYNKRYLLLQIA